MSASTIFIKRTLDYKKSLLKLKDKYKEKYKQLTPLLSLFLWSFNGLYTASRSGFSPNMTGVLLQFPVSDVLLIVSSSILLYRGLSGRNYIYLTFPWMALTLCSIYFNHYLGLMDILSNLKVVKKVSFLPWITLFISILLLVLRLTLTIRVFQLCIHLWLKEKLKEMKSFGQK